MPQRKCEIEAKKRYYKRRKPEVLKRTAERNKRITEKRKEMLAQFPCICCGESDPDLIQWHHVDESTKKFTVFTGAFGEEKFWDEVLKCIPVCPTCHVKIHKNKLCLLPPTL